MKKKASGGIRTRDPRLTKLREIDWQKFAQWVSIENNKNTAQDRIRYAQQYGYCLLRKNLSDLKLLSDDKRLHAMKSLSSLSKFIGQYDDWLSMVKNYGLKWTSRNGDDIIIGRLSKTTDASEIFDWVKTLKEIFPEFRDFVDLLIVTGLRFNEALASYNLIIKLSKEGKLEQYYNVEKGILEHFKFRDIFLRRTKKAFISFVPRELIQRISEDDLLSDDMIRGRLKRRKIPRRFSDVRELFGTLATKHLTVSETDFLQGRISKSVFMRNYFNPLLVADLKERAFKVVEEITNQIR